MKKILKGIVSVTAVSAVAAMCSYGYGAIKAFSSGGGKVNETITIVSNNAAKVQKEAVISKVKPGQYITISGSYKLLRPEGFVNKDTLLLRMYTGSKPTMYNFFYSLYNMKTGKLHKLKGSNCVAGDGKLSEDGTKLLYENRNAGAIRPYFYDIKNEKAKKLYLIGLFDTNFIDYGGRYIRYSGGCKIKNNKLAAADYYSDGEIVIDTTNWNVKCLGKAPINVKQFGGTTSSLISGIVFGGKIYSGIRNKNGTEIYYSDAKSAGHKTVLKFPDRKDKITQIDIINNGNSILFSGNYNREKGIFVYDMINKSIKKVVKLSTASASIDSMTFSLSSDRTKILYEVPEINKTRHAKIYIAAIQKNDILENKLLYQNTPNSSISPYDLHVVWTRDSKGFIAYEYHKNDKARTGYREYTYSGSKK